MDVEIMPNYQRLHMSMATHELMKANLASYHVY